MTKRASFTDKFDKGIGKYARIITSFGVIAGVVVWGYNFVAGRITTAINTEVTALHQEVTESSRRQEQQITRLELSDLIRNQPANKAAIEKTARYYFTELDGDTWMTEFYSKWAAEYGGDISFVLGGK